MNGEPSGPVVPVPSPPQKYAGVRAAPEISKYHMTFYHFMHLSKALETSHDTIYRCCYEEDRTGFKLRGAHRALVQTIMIAKSAAKTMAVKDIMGKIERKLKDLKASVNETYVRRIGFDEYQKIVDDLILVLELYYAYLQHIGLGIITERQQSFEQRIEDRI